MDATYNYVNYNICAIDAYDYSNQYIKIYDRDKLINMLVDNKVKILKLYSLFDDNISCEELCELLKTNTSVKSINIEFDKFCRKMNSDKYNQYCKLLFDAFTINKSITAIHLNFYNIYPDMFKYLINTIKNNNILTNFYITTTLIDFDSIAELLKENKILTDVRLFFDSGENLSSIDPVIEALENNRYITFMHLSRFKNANQRNRMFTYYYRNAHNSRLKSLMIEDL
jgi:hypothetical protein